MQNSKLLSKPTDLYTNDPAWEQLQKHYTNPELSRIMHLAEHIDKKNMLVEDDVPLDLRKLMEIIDYNKANFNLLLRKLVWHTIIIITRAKDKSGSGVKSYVIFNPYIAMRSSKGRFNITGFKDISKGLEPIDLKTLPKLPPRLKY